MKPDNDNCPCPARCAEAKKCQGRCNTTAVKERQFKCGDPDCNVCGTQSQASSITQSSTP